MVSGRHPVQKIYKLLLKRFGSQGWWPTTPPRKIHPRYHSRPKTKNLTEREKFEICLGAVLTQNTAWTNVEKALAELHRLDVRTPEKISNLRPVELERIIRSSGYFRQKAKKLKFFSNYLIKNYSGRVKNLFRKPFPDLRRELLDLYGVGPETADSILLYAGGRPVFVVDAYTRRIGKRLGWFKTDDYSAVQSFFETRLRKSAALFNEFHALLVRLGKDHCRTRPLCGGCPLSRDCRTGRKVLKGSVQEG